MAADNESDAISPSLIIKPSALLPLLARLPPEQQKFIGFDSFELRVGEILFAGLQIWLDESDSRSLEDRLTVLEPEIDECLRLYTEDNRSLEDEGDVEAPRWLRLFRDSNVRLVTLRLLGSATTHHLRQAWRLDAAILSQAGRRLLGNILYIAQAVDNCINILTPSQRSELPQVLTMFRDKSALTAVVHLDKTLKELENQGISLDSTELARASERASEIEPVNILDPQLEREVDRRLSEEIQNVLSQLDDSLAQKAQGAKDALSSSSDAISQAAHSLVELIDRTLRLAFADVQVMQWLDSSDLHTGSDLTYSNPTGETAPTKKAVALCFAYAGSHVTNRDIHYLFALCANTIVEARAKLQRLKHADTGHSSEEVLIRECLDATVSALTLVMKVNWRMVEDDGRVSALRDRIRA